jgi:hypothetical protein
MKQVEIIGSECFNSCTILGEMIFELECALKQIEWWAFYALSVTTASMRDKLLMTGNLAFAFYPLLLHVEVIFSWTKSWGQLGSRVDLELPIPHQIRTYRSHQQGFRFDCIIAEDIKGGIGIGIEHSQIVQWILETLALLSASVHVRLVFLTGIQGLILLWNEFTKCISFQKGHDWASAFVPTSDFASG